MEHDAQHDGDCWIVLHRRQSSSGSVVSRYSEASWDLISEACSRHSVAEDDASMGSLQTDRIQENSPGDKGMKTSDALATPLLNTTRAGPLLQASVDETEPPSAEDRARFTGDALVALVCEKRWADALAFWRKAPPSLRAAMQHDSCGEPVFSWCVYKAKFGGKACLEFLSTLLVACPAIASERSSNRFLPLHEAAWGNAHPAVALLLCAANPAALHDAAQGNTPHQIGLYHHKDSFVWPAPDKLLVDASALHADSSWLEEITALNLPSDCNFMKCMSAGDVASWLTQWNAQFHSDAIEVPLSVACLVRSFVSDRPTPAPRQKELSVGALAYTFALKPSAKANVKLNCRLRVPVHARKDPCGSDFSLPLTSDDVEYVREPAAKDERRYAGLKRARNTRCGFREAMDVQDTGGRRHYLIVHAVRTLSKDVQKRTSAPKWPAKVFRHRQRALERDQKASVLNLEW